MQQQGQGNEIRLRKIPSLIAMSACCSNVVNLIWRTSREEIDQKAKSRQIDKLLGRDKRDFMRQVSGIFSLYCTVLYSSVAWPTPIQSSRVKSTFFGPDIISQLLPSQLNQFNTYYVSFVTFSSVKRFFSLCFIFPPVTITIIFIVVIVEILICLQH